MRCQQDRKVKPYSSCIRQYHIHAYSVQDARPVEGDFIYIAGSNNCGPIYTEAESQRNHTPDTEPESQCRMNEDGIDWRPAARRRYEDVFK
eukprot:34493-Eustigmatos_ZCMA.PRE.1